MSRLMRKNIISLVFCFVSVLAFAQDRIVERTYVTTDRSVYVAGDDVWCSAFCVDVTDGGRLSDFSSVCYLELVSTSGPVVCCKLALEHGRGAGHFRIPVNAPTGNYRLVAYTAVNRNEVGMDYLPGAPVISVYNTLSNSRCAEVVFDRASVPAAVSSVNDYQISLNVDEKGILTLGNEGDESVTLSLSMSAVDGIASPLSTDIHGFADILAKGVKPEGFEINRIPEYDGEIITVRVPKAFSGSTGFISSPGNKSNIYTSDVDDNGVLTFFTGNIYGETNMVLQLDSENAGSDYTFEVESPFVNPGLELSDVPSLYLGEELREDLLRKSLSMQLSDKFGTSILTEYLPERPNLLFSGDDLVSYKLEDYTRFQTFREVFVEYVKQASVRKGRICVIINDVVLVNSLQPTISNSALVLLDGVPVLDHELVLDMDPALVKRLDIYQHTVAVGSRVYGGVVNFVTIREDMAGVKLPDAARMLDFNGVSYPVALTGERIDSNYPDYRQTLLWQPLVRLAPGEKVSFRYKLPAYEGKFSVKACGMTPSGKPLTSSLVF